MLELLVQSLTLVLPIFISGIVFIIVLKDDRVHFFDTPVDFGQKIFGKRIFGDNKTWCGVVVYVLFSLAVCVLLHELYSSLGNYVHPVFSQPALYVGLVFSISYVCGELLNSFIKRRFDIAPGKSTGRPVQQVIDNVDGMLMTALALITLLSVSLGSIAVALVAGFLLHEITDVVMRQLHLK